MGQADLKGCRRFNVGVILVINLVFNGEVKWVEKFSSGVCLLAM